MSEHWIVLSHEHTKRYGLGERSLILRETDVPHTNASRPAVILTQLRVQLHARYSAPTPEEAYNDE
jgi:hypothetical protein